ncbi:glycosyl transferase [Lysinibacillus sp. FJAT-14745]|uniref:glycosyltransferase family 2 protein n=1 Tax=Lysinibacillus sp. FJAT-14745 TaxID=1704289 RepID=UPI0006ABA7B1|nr:glycosyltransferase family 2 protein [Lysinibacillus sp. FJAT-14745]KOP77798.1 glycosyl transferase [Lysinibacillus sp. FJAT-14745]
MNHPLVSIITPSFNSSRFIEDTINSVLNQTYPHFELIIVDDCSKDNSWEMITAFSKKDERIKIYQLEKNSGAATARNFGIQASNGKYLAFLDSDDLWDQHKLEAQVKFMESNNYVFSFTNYKMIDEKGNSLNKTVTCPSVIDYKSLLKNTTIGCLTVMLNIEQLGKPTMPNLQPEDTALWLKILRNNNKAYCFQEVLASYRIVGNSASSNKLKVAKKMWIVYRKSENINRLKASWYFVNYALNAVKKHYL